MKKNIYLGIGLISFMFSAYYILNANSLEKNLCERAYKGAKFIPEAGKFYNHIYECKDVSIPVTLAEKEAMDHYKVGILVAHPIFMFFIFNYLRKDKISGKKKGRPGLPL